MPVAPLLTDADLRATPHETIRLTVLGRIVRPRRFSVALAFGFAICACAVPAPTSLPATGEMSPAPPVPGGASTDAGASAGVSPRSADPAGSAPSATTSPPQIDPAELSGTIAFSFDDGIWTADASGAHRRQVTRDGGFDPTLSPDGTTIVYRKLLEHDDGEIWIIDASGAHARDLVNDPDFSDWGPAYSPDGKKIAYDSNRRGGGIALWVMDANGAHQGLVAGGHGEYPSWAPDGRRLAYAGGAYYDIRVVDLDGSGDHALTTTAAYDMGPAWSPDGAWIAYHTQADAYPNLAEAGMGPEMEIHLIRPDGSEDHRITDDAVEDAFPAWSPDGRFLMWSRHGELVVARPDGSGRIEIGSGNFPSWVR